MIDIITGIAAATEALKLTKELRNIEHELDKSELKIHLVTVINLLVDAQQALQEAKSEQRSLREQISELTEAARIRKSLLYDQGKLHEIDHDGSHVGDPYCHLCFVRDGKLYHLTLFPGSFLASAQYTCPNCNSVVYA